MNRRSVRSSAAARHRFPTLLPLLALLLSALVACQAPTPAPAPQTATPSGTGSPSGTAAASPSASATPTPAPSSASKPAEAAKPAGTPQHIFVINLENKGYDSVWGDNSPAPYLSGTLRKKGVLLTNYYGIAHNSLPNYLAQISGQRPND
ncbi:MAG TPA: hypothetical protein VGE95_21705, partial [Arthrobacter sp.]